MESWVGLRSCRKECQTAEESGHLSTEVQPRALPLSAPGLLQLLVWRIRERAETVAQGRGQVPEVGT